MKKNPKQKPKVTRKSKKPKYQSGSKNVIVQSLGQRKKKKLRVKQAMEKNTAIPTRKLVKHTKSEYKKAQKRYKAKNNQRNNLKRSLIQIEKEVVDHSVSHSSQDIRARTFSKIKITKELRRTTEDVKSAKEDVKMYKEVHKKTKKADTTSTSNQIKRQLTNDLKNQTEEKIAQEDTLAEVVTSRREGRKRTNTYQTTKYAINTSHRMNVKLVKGTYGVSSRTYNFVRGKGFQKTPEEFSTVQKTAKKYRNFQNRLKMSQIGKAAKGTSNFFGSIIKIVNNPFKVKSMAILGAILLTVLIIFMFIPLSMPGSIQQDEFDLTDSWEYLTKVDADRSDDVYSFYTEFDETMFYMNYRFEDYKISDRAGLLTFKTYGDYLNGIWESMNDTKGKEYKFTSMYELAKNKSSDYYLNAEDFNELKEIADEYGYSMLDGQLEFPFQTDDLPILRRYGYEVTGDKVQMHSTIEIESQQGLDIKAPMAGTVQWNNSKNQVIIKEDGKEGSQLAISGVNAGRQDSGSKVKNGDLIAKASNTKISISYKKYDEEKDKMRFVNPAFYFPKVTYRQKTTVTEPFEPEGGELKNARFIYEKLIAEGNTLEGICAILGNFSVESGINPKRAEGDYLSPPIGASKDSWDDPKWLSMGGMEIYGKYPNIIHRGLGLGQWTDTSDGGTRHTLLVDFSKAKKKKWYSIGLQLDFMQNGDVPAYRTMFKNVASGKAANGLADLTRYFLVHWEGNPGDKLEQRTKAAEKWYQYFKENPDGDGGSNGYALPIEPPNISSWFGIRELGFHRGIDFAHPQGTSIKAIGDGTVITAEYHYSWGNHIRIKHANGQTSLYAHCSVVKVKVGDKVKKGDVIGLVGNTGNSFGAHLHLEISKSTDLSVSSLLDPAKVLGIKE
ncbi:peptidoglycan DD-metalloendopeptidase family protein [Enterococcus faecium]|nr:peptidoglycan DD-metalloendopeptidase family protein [Enterococcus faecium]